MDNTFEKLTEILRNGILAAMDEDNRYLYTDVVDYMMAHGVTLDNQVSSNKWIPVTERLPDKHGKYLTVVPSRWVGVEHGIWVIWYHPKSGFYDSDPEWGDIEMDDVTHWMPLPEPPKGD